MRMVPSNSVFFPLNLASKFTASVEGSLPGAGSVIGKIAQHKSAHGPVESRIGIYARNERPEDAPYDQCVFIRTCQAKRRPWDFLMRGGAGPDQLPDQREADAGRGGPAVQAKSDSNDMSTADATVSRLLFGSMGGCNLSI